MLKILLAASLLALPAAAQTPPAAPAGTVAASDVISAAVGEWTGDGRPDHAVLVRHGEDSLDLYIYASDPTPDDAHHVKLAAYAPGFDTMSADNDDTQELDVKTYTSLQYFTQYTKGGTQTVKLGYRGGQFVVTGLNTYDDDPSTDKANTCDINFLTGKGTLNKKPVKVPAGGVPVTQWTFEKVIQFCPS